MSYPIEYKSDFTGGENTFATPDELSDNQLLQGENLDFVMRGGFARRGGIEEYAVLGAAKIDRLIEYEYITAEGLVNKKLSLTGGELRDVATNSVLLADAGEHCDTAVFKDKLYLLIANNYMVYDGTTIAAVTNTNADSNLANIKKCKYLEQRGQRLFACGNPDDPNALYFSEVGDPTYFKVLSIIQAVSHDGDILSGLKEFNGGLVAFKARTAYVWYGSDPTSDVTFQRLNVASGTKYYRTIQRINNMLVYLGNDDVYALVGTEPNYVVTRRLSSNRSNKFRNIPQLPGRDYYKSAPCAVVHKGKYMLSVPTTDATKNDLVHVLFVDMLDRNTECWAPYIGWNISEWLLTNDGALLSGSSITGRIHRHDDTLYSDLGLGIRIAVRTKPYAQGALILKKKYRYGWVCFRQYEAQNSHMTVTGKVDYREIEAQPLSPDQSSVYDADDAEFDDTVWDYDDMVTRRFAIKLQGKRLTLEFTDDTVGEPLLIYGFGVEYKVKKADKS